MVHAVIKLTQGYFKQKAISFLSRAVAHNCSQSWDSTANTWTGVVATIGKYADRLVNRYQKRRSRGVSIVNTIPETKAGRHCDASNEQ